MFFISYYTWVSMTVEHNFCCCSPSGNNTSRAGTSLPGASRDTQLTSLRQAIARIERKQTQTRDDLLSIGLPEIHDHLPGDGLALGVLHEVMAAAYGDRPSAVGFAFALMARALQARPGPAMLVMTQRALNDHGRPYAHGLRLHGIDLRRLVVIETRKPATYDLKILNIYFTKQNSNWIGGGVTYRRSNAPNFSTNDGLNKEIQKNSKNRSKNSCLSNGG